MRIFLLIGFLRGYKLLKRLLDRGESIVGVYVFEEDSHERTKYAEKIVSLCQVHQIPVKRTRKVTQIQVEEIVANIAPEVIFCNGWRTLFPVEVLTAAPRGVVAAHDSLLPHLRGFAPTNWAMILGHDIAGVTLFHMSPGMDEGDVYFQQSIPLKSSDTRAHITDLIADLSVCLFEKYLDAVRDGTLTAIPQENEKATYTCSRTPDDGEIDWSSSTGAIVDLVRAIGPPGPGAYTYYNRQILRILKASAVLDPRHYQGRIPGRVVAISNDSIDVLSGDGLVRIEEVESDLYGICSPNKIIKSVRAQLGLQPSIEIVRLYSLIEELQNKLIQMQEELARSKEEHSPLDVPLQTCQGNGHE
jgi:methionyl-tRNA formyltransferase